jgi:hypothetical protein
MNTNSKIRLIAVQMWLWLIFAMLYRSLDRHEPGKHFGTSFNAAYFAAMNQTLGSNEDPLSPEGKFLVVCHVTLASVSFMLLL